MATDIDRWLESLGLSAYREAFAGNDIDLATLRLLTAEDLQQIGVKSVGHRRRMLEAIAALGGEPATPQEAAKSAAPAPPPKQVPARTSGPERRQITVMFCDLVDSTALSVRLDPEDLHELLTAYRACIAETVQGHRGFIAHYVGDGVFIYFGYPQAHEQDAERALRTGLAIIRKLGRLAPIAGAVPQVRIGVATGLVVVGNVAEGGAAAKVDVTGETPNLAARIQALARANELVIAESTRALVGNLFDCMELGRFEVKGIPDPVPAWRVTGERAFMSRYDAIQSARGGTDLVGRESELARIEDRLAAARAGSGQVVLVVSQPGFGKSRLVEEVHRIAAAEARGRFVLQCSPDQEQTPFYPIIHQLEYAAGIGTEDAALERRDKLEALLKRIGGYSADRLAVVLDLLRVELEAAPASHAVKIGMTRARTMKALLEITEAALDAASVMVVEDLHWADPSTVELLDRVVAMVRNVSALVVATARPEFVATWEDQPHVTVLRLDRLPPAELRRLVLGLAKGDELPPFVVDQIVARSDGVPLFALELARGILASGHRQGGALAIPSSLTESLLARLDRLQHGRETAQLAAVIGREFPVALLMSISAEEAEATRAGVRRLLESGIFVRRHSSFGEAAGFSHMLLRDAAYNLLLRRDRGRLHDQVAQSLERQFPEMATAMPQLVAHHFTEAGNRGKAIEYWERAGADAAARSSPVEAIADYEKALELLATLPAAGEREERELALRLGMIGPLIAVRGHGSRDVADAVEQALELHRRLDSRQSIVPPLTLKWLAQLGGSDNEALYGTARLISEKAAEGTEVDRLLARRTMGTTLLFRGDLEAAVREFEAFLEIYDPAGHDAALAKAGATSHAGASLLGLSECFTLMDRPAERDKWRNALFAHARERNHVPSLCPTLTFGGCWISATVRNFEEFAPYAEELGRLVQRHDLTPWQPHANLMIGLARIHRGSNADAFALARRGIDALVAMNAYALSSWIVLFADACDACGRIEEAAALLPVAELRIEKGERWVAAEFHRLRAKLGAARGSRTASIDGDFEEAMAIAERQGAALLVERARDDLARWRR
ncbi:MAG: AAA family ATPase [Alphaproteobacteria bacterium]|nr:AAA family ATPase [Alphaproteobacteria bacterium]MBV8409349.1 AAA family ATPase [Alphaproteobacteria bacterium]